MYALIFFTLIFSIYFLIGIGYFLANLCLMGQIVVWQSPNAVSNLSVLSSIRAFQLSLKVRFSFGCLHVCSFIVVILVLIVLFWSLVFMFTYSVFSNDTCRPIVSAVSFKTFSRLEAEIFSKEYYAIQTVALLSDALFSYHSECSFISFR